MQHSVIHFTAATLALSNVNKVKGKITMQHSALHLTAATLALSNVHRVTTVAFSLSTQHKVK